jgi:hypothetical protein
MEHPKAAEFFWHTVLQFTLHLAPEVAVSLASRMNACSNLLMNSIMLDGANRGVKE